MKSFFAKVKFFRFWPIFASPKKVWRNVCCPKENEKRNLMAFVSVAQHLRVGSYERLRFLFTVHFEWRINLETKSAL